MGAGTYTGIEAVSNGLPIPVEPWVRTGRRTMAYMGISLALVVAGLLVAYLLCVGCPCRWRARRSTPCCFDRLTGALAAPLFRTPFVWITLVSEAALLIIAAQTGFLDGSCVMANMALDRWFPSRFATLSDRFVTQNGVLLMGASAFIMMAVTRGSVDLHKVVL